MLRIEQLSKVFYPGTVNEKTAIEYIDLDVRDGDFITVVGSNGSGKSTLFNLISGTYPVTGGKIILNGKDVTNSPEYRRAFTIGRIFQDPTKGTAAKMSIEDNMITAFKKGMKGLGISLNASKRGYFKEELKQLSMGLEDRLKDNVGLLSGGQRQALTLLMTVLSRPQMLLLDEHTAALDPRNAQIVMDLTTEFISRYRLTTLMVTHNMQHAIDFGNRLIMMDGGKIILDLSQEEKHSLTVPKLVKMFKSIKNQEYVSDEDLLTP
ncbi:MAG: ATP-binding cassette domain-containing protein [Sphaerochaetaceae bacterium]|jgi:putative ABC transport system ATP-binding protein|nr:ATP-binding cassette domain-containing protein [Sphaerochaetaceae bacterium]MDX9938950.1 ATP-binding cassette domain-containing protein [Sphaerochaetaceae bacterium]